jgi:hypothetical protein
MKNPNESPKMNCDDIQRLLVNRISDELTRDEDRLVDEHLKSCGHCRAYQNTLLSLKDSMQIGRGEKLVPDPAIRENVLQRIKTLQPQETGILRNAWQHIRSIFEYRIPVYQTLSGVVVIILIFLAIKQITFSPGQQPPEPQSLVRMEMPSPSEMSVVDNLDIIAHQKIGRSAKEDTALTRFIVSTM